MNKNVLSELLEDGLLLEVLPVYEKGKNSFNSTRSTLGSQETETDKLPGESKISRGPE